MSAMRTDKYIVTEQSREQVSRGIPGLSLSDDVVKGSFFLDCNWVKPRTKPTRESTTSHTHDSDEVIGFFGTNLDDWRDLGGEVELWLDGEKHILTKTCMVYIPKGMRHCPMTIRRVDRPIFLFSTGPASTYVKQDESLAGKEKSQKVSATKTAKYIITEQTEKQRNRGSRGLTINDEVVKGINFFLQCGWLLPRKEATKGAHNSNTSHSHDCDEVIAFFGTDVANWRDLGGEVELWLDDEKHMLTKSFLIFVPKNMKHCPLVVHRVDRPIFHFTTGPAPGYVIKNEALFPKPAV